MGFTAIYDEDNGHWLTMPDRKEIGYLNRIKGPVHHSETITHIEQFA